MIKIPEFKIIPQLETTLKEIAREMENLRERTISKETANNSLILQAADGSTWEIKVDSAGAITTIKLSG